MIIISFRYAIRFTDYQLQLSHQIHQLQTIIQKLILIVIINSDFLYFWFLFICSVFSTFEVLSWNSLYSRSNNSRLYHPILRLKKVAMTILEVALLYATLSKYSVTEHFLSQSGGTFLHGEQLTCAYIDKTFNGQSWFRYKEDALRNEPMNTRQETYAAIKKMIATLDDSFTVFWSPKSLKVCGQSGTHNVLTGVGLSIGYPTGKNESVPGLVVIATSAGGPANRAGISPGDIILPAQRRWVYMMQQNCYKLIQACMGISMTQELLFHGALLPLFGINWQSVVAVASIFGILHLKSGWKYSFTAWYLFKLVLELWCFPYLIMSE